MRGILIDINQNPIETTFIDQGKPLSIGEILKALQEAQAPLIAMLAKVESENKQAEATDDKDQQSPC